MTEGPPIACTLNAGDLQERLNEIAAIGADSLVARGSEGSHQQLRFRASEPTRQRLEAIVAAEAQCCSFLDLSLEEQDEELVLSIGAPAEGEPVAAALATAFTQQGSEAESMNSQRTSGAARTRT